MRRYSYAGSLVVVFALVATAGMWTHAPGWVSAHCQVPCGIYDDAARIAQLKEDSTTIAKAITQINEMVDEDDGMQAKNVNQVIRWVTTKEDHASRIITVVSEYFLTQKVKPVAPGADGYDAYLKSLADHHAVMAAAMKTKQDAAPATVDALNQAIAGLAKHYHTH